MKKQTIILILLLIVFSGNAQEALLFQSLNTIKTKYKVENIKYEETTEVHDGVSMQRIYTTSQDGNTIVSNYFFANETDTICLISVIATVDTKLVAGLMNSFEGMGEEIYFEGRDYANRKFLVFYKGYSYTVEYSYNKKDDVYIFKLKV